MPPDAKTATAAEQIADDVVARLLSQPRAYCCPHGLPRSLPTGANRIWVLCPDCVRQQVLRALGHGD